MAFNPDKYKAIFEKRFGKGSFDAGLSDARQIGTLKVQASQAKQDYTKRLRDAQAAAKKAQKAQQAQQPVYGDITASEANKMQEKAAKEGRGGSQPSYDYARKEARRNSKEVGLPPFTKTPSTYDETKLTEYAKHSLGYPSNFEEPTKNKPKKKAEPSLLNKVGNGLYHGLDTVFTGLATAGERFDNELVGTLFHKTNEKANKAQAKLIAKELKKNPNDPSAKASAEMFKNAITKKASTPLEKATNLAGGLAGNTLPYAIGDGLLGLAGKGVGAVAKGSQLVNNPLLKLTLNGAASGAAGSGVDMAAKRLVDGQKFTPGEVGKNLALNAGAGAVLAPVAHGVLSNLNLKGQLSKALKGTGNVPFNADAFQNALNDVHPKQQPQLLLNAPQLQLPGPKPPTMDEYLKLFKQPKGLKNPIPEIPSAMKPQIIKKRFEDAGVGFGQGSKYAPKARQPIYENTAIDPLKRSPEYWQKRYEDFAKFTKDSGYTDHNLSEDAIQELWTHFAKHDEPVSIQQVVDLAYPKGFEAPPKPVPPKPEHPLITALKNDPVINQKIKEFFPPVRPEPKVSRLATTEEILNHMESQLPPKQTPPELKPLQFKVEKGFNPKLQPKILNREGKGLEAIKKGKVKSIGSTPKVDPNTIPQDAHGYGLVDAKAEKQSEIDKLLANSHTWKDKAKFALKRETMVRNFEDIMGKDASKMKYKYLNNISKSEADSVRFKNAERESIGKYGIKAYSKDSALVQMYGEGKISLDELKKESKNWKDVVKLTEHLRSKYDEWLPMMNKALTEHGYDPVPQRQNYFPHMEDLTKFEKFLRDNVGIDMTDNTLPTEINGRTAQFKPGKQFFRNALQRKGDQTAYDAVLGADKYLEGMSNVVHHTKNIKQLRDLANGIRGKFDGNSKHLSNFVAELDEFTNNFAGKKAVIDRAVEDTFGRKAYNVVDTLRRKTGVNMVGANLGSALTNFIPLTQSLASTNKAAFVKGLTETMANVVKNDGFANKSDFLTRRIGSDPLSQTLFENVANKSMALMRGFDRFTSQLIVRSKYHDLLGQGMPEERALRKADEWAAKIMADRSKGSMPTLFNSKTLGLFSQFQLEVNNQLSHLVKDLPRDSKSKAELASRYAQVLLYSYLFNNLYEKAVGRRPAIDPIGIAFQANTDYNNEHISTGKATKNLAGNILNQLPFTSALTGGRIPISAAIPNVMGSFDGSADWKKEALKPLIYLAPPAAGSQVKKTYEGLTSMGLNPLSKQNIPGEYTPNGKLRYPVDNGVPNLLRAGLFGKSSLPEANDYYNNNKKPLSAKQTQAVERSSNPIETFKQISKQRSAQTIMDKIKKLQKDGNISNAEKAKNLQELIKQLNNLKEGK